MKGKVMLTIDNPKFKIMYNIIERKYMIYTYDTVLRNFIYAGNFTYKQLQNIIPEENHDAEENHDDYEEDDMPF
jgi:hypothetical protein